MKMTKTMLAAAVMTAAFAFSAVAADPWYEGNNVAVSGTGTASVTYRSESATTAWLDIAVADGATATLTSLVNARRPKNWAVMSTQNAIRAQYAKPGNSLIIR